MKRRISLLLMSALIFLAACGLNGTPQTDDFQILVASDLHYLSPALTDHGPLFQQLVDNADGKLMHVIEELTDAFLSEVVEQKPDALILTGDLSFNGAVMSHEALAEKLHQVESEGVPVLVLTGNHDLYNTSAAAFSGESYTRVPSADQEAFREIYWDFGLGEAIAADEDSLSYVYQLNDSTRILMLDANTAHDPCGLSEKTLRWVGKQLRQARREEQNVIAACHQNLMQHSMFRGGYVLNRTEKLQTLLSKYGVKLFLSGHLHIQHIQEQNGITEIASSALSVWPCQYGMLTGEKGSISYRTRQTDVTAWAEKHGKTQEELLQFEEYARDYMEARTRRQVPEWLTGLPYTEEELQQMTDYMCRLNLAYFSGDLQHLEDLDTEAAVLWKNSGTLTGVYLDAVWKERGNNYTQWKSG